MPLLVAVAATLQIVLSPVIAINHGYGFDGELYGRLASSLSWKALYRTVDSYRLQRVLPSILVGSVLKGLGLHTAGAVVRAFQILTALELVAAAWLWHRIAALVRLDRCRAWLGFVLMFGSFALLSEPFFYPVSTDTTAFLFGLVLVHAYLRRSTSGLVATGLIGAFAWPICLLAVAVLLLWPAGAAPLPTRRTALGTVASSAAAIALVMTGIAVRTVKHRTHQGLGPVNDMVDGLLPISATLHLPLVGFALIAVIGGASLPQIGMVLRALKPINVALAALVLILPKLVIAQLAGSQWATLSGSSFVAMLAFLPLVRPGIMPVAHFAYFGLALPLFVLQWRRIGEAARRLGAGATAFLLLALALALTPESRQSILTYPALVTLLCCATPAAFWTGRKVAVVGVVQLLLARPWISQNAGRDPASDGIGGLPNYFMSQGPYMQAGPWLAFLSLMIIATLLCLALVREWPGRGIISAD